MQTNKGVKHLTESFEGLSSFHVRISQGQQGHGQVTRTLGGISHCFFHHRTHLSLLTIRDTARRPMPYLSARAWCVHSPEACRRRISST